MQINYQEYAWYNWDEVVYPSDDTTRSNALHKTSTIPVLQPTLLSPLAQWIS